MNTRTESTIDCRIGERLKSFRKAAGLSQKELATQIGVSFQQIQKYESGGNRIAAGRLWQLSDILKVKMQRFFEEDEKKKWEENIKINDVQTTTFLRRYYKLQPRARSALLDFLESL